MFHAIHGGCDTASSVARHYTGVSWISPSADIGASSRTVISAPLLTFLPFSFHLFSLLSHLQPFRTRNLFGFFSLPLGHEPGFFLFALFHRNPGRTFAVCNSFIEESLSLRFLFFALDFLDTVNGTERHTPVASPTCKSATTAGDM